MSATNRGAQRVAEDAYPTPVWAVRALLAGCHLPGGTWLEPAAGDGAIVRMVNACRRDVTWYACDVREECWPAIEPLVDDGAIGDFLQLDWSDWPAPAVIITNPPYSLAEAFVRKALEVPGAVVVMLLRLNWLAGQKRAAWLRANTPSVYVLPRRPAFVNGRTDATDYGWLVWGLHEVPQVHVLRLEDCW